MTPEEIIEVFLDYFENRMHERIDMEALGYAFDEEEPQTKEALLICLEDFDV